MYLIVGLGNPGGEYSKTRHNAGFMAVDWLRNKWDFPEFKAESKFNATISVETFHESSLHKIIMIKPNTFMNNSGKSVQAVSNFYKIPVKNIIVIYDDLDLTELGDIKWRHSEGTGAGGHNGIKDIIEKLGSKNFPRVKIGISGEDRPEQMSGADYVLSKFKPGEIEKLEGSFALVEQKILNYID